MASLDRSTGSRSQDNFSIPAAPQATGNPSTEWSDEDLVAACLRGDQTAWAAIVEKYRNLVYSVPLKYRFSQEDSADIFQAVWVDLMTGLRALRSPAALPAWLMTAASHRCYHHQKRLRRMENHASVEDAGEPSTGSESLKLIQDVQREQMVRNAMTQIPDRCRRMMTMLFYEHPPMRYKEVATRLGLAEGSIGFIRGRCLKRLKNTLESMGF